MTAAPPATPDVRRRQNGWGRGAYFVNCRLCGRRISDQGPAKTQAAYYGHLQRCLGRRRRD